jgi:hypothetical protein
VLSSSNGGSLVDFSTGTKDVFVTYPAEKSINEDASGNVGIGTTAPGSKLDVSGTSGAGASIGARVTNTTASGFGSFEFSDGTNTKGQIWAGNGSYASFGGAGSLNYSANSGPHVWYTNYSERMRISAAGDVGINTSSPGGTYGKLTVAGGMRTVEDTSSKLEIGRYSSGAPNSYIKLSPNSASLRFTNAADDTDLMTLTNAGNLGIGTTAPAYKLDVAGTVNTSQALRFGASYYEGAATYSISNYLTNMVYNVPTGSGFVWGIAGADTMLINSSGNVGIGTSSPGAKLEVAGGDLRVNGTGTGNIGITLKRTAGTTSDWYQYIPSGTDAFVWFQGGIGAERMRIDSSGNVGIGTSSPSSKLTVASSNVTVNAGYGIAFTGDQNRIITPDDGVFGALIKWGATGGCRFIESATERMRIDNSGNLLVGTTTALGKITLQGNTNADINTWIRNDSAGSSSRASIVLNASGNSWRMGMGSSANNSNALTWDLDVSSPSEKMRLDTSGNLGIGTSSPGSKLDVVAQDAIRITGFQPFQTWRDSNDSNKGFRIQTAGGATLFSNDSTGGGTYTERMRLDSSGNVGIGTSAPKTRLQATAGGGLNAPSLGSATNAPLYVTTTDTAYGLIAGVNSSDGHVFLQAQRTDGTATAYNITLNEAGGDVLIGTTVLPNSSTAGMGYSRSSTFLSLSCGATTSSVTQVYFTNGNGTVGSISTNGTATAYNTSSDYRLKKVDGPLKNSGAYIDALKPVEGSWKADGKRFIGLLAHEVQEVSETPIATGEKDGEEMQAMDYSAPELIANLIAEIQSLRARVAELEGK